MRFLPAFLLLTLPAFSAPSDVAIHYPHPVPAIQDTEAKAQRDARMAWWREAHYGLFICWGLSSIPAGTWEGKQYPADGEWIMEKAKIPVAQYKALAKQFNPTKFDADAWVALAKKAGMKYIVITAKHHDGFAMFKSEADPFNIVDATPFKRDPLKELAAACEKQGIKLGFYYSQDQDWTAVGGGAYGPRDLYTLGGTQHYWKPPTDGAHEGRWDQAQEGNFADYIHHKAIPQLKELLTNYQPYPSNLWFDTPKDMTSALAGDVVTLLNGYPNLIWNNRLGADYPGDTETPEQKIPPQGFPGRDWETCMTMNTTWGYKSYDHDFKSTQVLLRNLIDIVSKGGNYLLSIGPDSTGTIPQPEVDRLIEIGKWLDVNGEAIYGCTASTLHHAGGAYSATKKDDQGKPIWIPAWDWRSTMKPGKIYVHLLSWPGTKFQVAGFPDKVTKAYLLADPKRAALPIAQKGGELTVTLPAQAPDSLASVLALDVTDEK